MLPFLALLCAGLVAHASDFWTVLPMVQDMGKALQQEDQAPCGTLTFDGLWNETLKGRIKGGRTLEIVYDNVRATSRASGGTGIAAWGVEGNARFFIGDGSIVIHTFPAVTFENDPETGVSIPLMTPFLLQVPEGAVDVEFWFRNWAGGERPTEVLDNNGGYNYRYRVQPAHPTVYFDKDGAPTLVGRVVAGDTLTVVYNPAQANRRGERFGAPVWGVDGVVAFQGKGRDRKTVPFEAVSFEKVGNMPVNKPIANPFTATIPVGTRRVEIWFNNWTGTRSQGVTMNTTGAQVYPFEVEKE